MEVDDSEDEEGDEKLCDPTAEFVADVRNALGDVAAVDSDQVIHFEISSILLLVGRSP